ncbi:hypothetical protein [Anaerococcus hydrogenalis]|uniref:Uncharacterized protein n=1 Tax=Anaerococcus hydrogenalis TaxID=33029 RepID=A0A2N6UIG8_9FIRM|nr:hypothetical protein [Anaerococcus hydrogenalis]MDK7694745.1 hypothetical protein [Anaerococcus hydrogenalis]MDK7696701.1 hypothetical protein [Anaerococcus hydrogenalis]MDK7707772.1 hypothetical protein [Anaerococcus hydrogenalis]PMC81383.1 hypothetical protein CJ192_04985 [Anaerococcus hydrogenalis]
MENKKVRRIRKRSQVFEMLDGKKLDDACVRFTAKPERERMRDKFLGIFVVGLCMTLAIAGPSELIRVSGIVAMFLGSLMAFLA